MKQNFTEESPPIKYKNIAELPDLITYTPLQNQNFDIIKPKIPPRSCLQFKIGPSFSMHKQYDRVVKTSKKQNVFFNLTSRIDRGFDLNNSQWIGYKRNYFTLVASFQSSISDIIEFVNESYTLELKENENSITCKIIQFGIKIMSKIEGTDKEINLVQHTAKRDKGPHGKPQICPVVPASLPDHETIRSVTNVKCPKKNAELEKAFYFYYQNDKEKNLMDNTTNNYYYHYRKNINTIVDPLYKGYPNQCIDKVAKFERIQFSCSSGIRKSNCIGRYFQLYVILGVIVEIPNIIELKETIGIEFLHTCNTNHSKKYFINLIEIKTPPLVIRGRSPASYNNEVQISKFPLVDCKNMPEFSHDNFLEESSPLKKPNNNITDEEASLEGRPNTKSIIDKSSPRNSHDINLINTLNTNFFLSSSKMSSPTKLGTPKIPYFMNKKHKPSSDTRQALKLRNIQRLEELEKEISEKRQNNILEDYPKPNFKFIESPDKRLLKPINIKDIETKSTKRPRKEKIVILGPLLYSTNLPIYNNPKYTQYQTYMNDIKPKPSVSHLEKEIYPNTSELNTNDLSATNITFSHLYSDKFKNSKIDKNNCDKWNTNFYSSEDNFFNDIIMKGICQNTSYEYDRHQSINPSPKVVKDKVKNQQNIFSYISDNLLLNTFQSSEETIDDIKS